MSEMFESGSMVASGAVVEKGQARCSRCMAVAEYTFHEANDKILRYVVSCSTCSHLHSETFSSPDVLAA